MIIEQWLKKHNITNELEVLQFQAWYKFQAEKRHKEKLDIIQPDQVKFTKNTLDQMKLELIFKDRKKAVKLFGIDYGPQIFSIENSSMPNYLLTNKEIELGFYGIKGLSKNIPIDYSLFNHDVLKLDFYTKGEFMVHLPKNTHQMHKGASMMRNCVEIQATSLIEKFSQEPQKFIDKCDYLDAHILKDNQLVGILALEEINYILKHGSPRMSLFVNYSNSRNLEMEEFCIELVQEVLNITLPKYELKQSVIQPLRDTKNKECSSLLNYIK